VSEPTYLIRVEHDPAYTETTPWSASVTRISDGTHAVSRWGSTQEEAVRAAQAWIRAQASERLPSQEFYAQEDGTLLVGESVRVLRQP
jgi:hypothetical protein